MKNSMGKETKKLARDAMKDWRTMRASLSGIGPATADKIIAGRPYNSKRDLLTRKIVSQKEYDVISDKIVAHKANQ
jgi:DNA uptake protein ComE-like DNA-binding protein